MALIGSAFASEMFLLFAMFMTPRCEVLGVIVLIGRLLHLPAAVYLLLNMFSNKNSVVVGLLERDVILRNSKVFGVVALFSVIDSIVMRYFPWLSSPFSRKSKGYPNATVFLVCVVTKLVQSTITVSCQVSYFVLVNSAVTDNTPKAQQALAFLLINMTTTMLLVVINAFEFLMKRGILLGGTLSTVPDGPKSPPQPSLPPSSATCHRFPSLDHPCNF